MITCTLETLGTTSVDFDTVFFIESADALPSSPASTRVFRFSSIASSTESVRAIPIIHQCNLIDAITDGFIRNVGAAALSESSADEISYLQTEVTRGFPKAKYLRVAAADEMASEDNVRAASLDVSKTSDRILTILEPNSEHLGVWSSVWPGSGPTPLIFAASPVHWGVLDFVACFSQIPVTNLQGLFEAAVSSLAHSELKHRLTAAFSDPLLAARSRSLKLSPVLQPVKEDKMDIDDPHITSDDLEPPAAKRRKSAPRPSVAEDGAHRPKRPQIPPPREVDEPFFTPGEPEFDIVAANPLIWAPPAVHKSKPRSSDYVPPGSNGSSKAKREKPEREKSERQKSERSISDSSSRESRERTPKSAGSQLYTPGGGLVLPLTGAILEPQELMILEAMTATKRAAYFRTVKSFVRLRCGAAVFFVSMPAAYMLVP